jgi:hypothetical protein
MLVLAMKFSKDSHASPPGGGAPGAERQRGRHPKAPAFVYRGQRPQKTEQRQETKRKIGPWDRTSALRHQSGPGRPGCVDQ